MALEIRETAASYGIGYALSDSRAASVLARLQSVGTAKKEAASRYAQSGVRGIDLVHNRKFFLRTNISRKIC